MHDTSCRHDNAPANFAVYTEHAPSDFVQDTHYLQLASTGADLHPDGGVLPWLFPSAGAFGGIVEMGDQAMCMMEGGCDLIFRMQKVNGAYAHASMKIVLSGPGDTAGPADPDGITPMTGATSCALQSQGPAAQSALSSTCTVLNAGETPSVNRGCFQLIPDADAVDSTFTFGNVGGNLAVWTEHAPSDFALQDKSGADKVPTVQLLPADFTFLSPSPPTPPSPPAPPSPPPPPTYVLRKTGDFAKCDESSEFMPQTKEACQLAATVMSRGFIENTASDAPTCGVDESSGNSAVRWYPNGKVASTWGGGWRAVCSADLARPPLPPSPPAPSDDGASPAASSPTTSGDGDGGDAAPAEVESSVSFTMKASGDVADYTDAIKDSMAGTVATKAGVDKSKVTVDVTAGSVNIAFTITAASAAAATSAGAAVQASVASASAATTFFSSVPGITITVASVTAISAPVSTAAGGSPIGAIIGAVVGVVVVLGGVGVYCYLKKKKTMAKPTINATV